MISFPLFIRALIFFLTSTSSYAYAPADEYPDPQPNPDQPCLSTSDLIIRPFQSDSIPDETFDKIEILLPEEMAGTIIINNPTVTFDNLQITLTRVREDDNPSGNETEENEPEVGEPGVDNGADNPIFDETEVEESEEDEPGEEEPGGEEPSEDDIRLVLIPEISKDGRSVSLPVSEPLDLGKWRLDIPAGYFEIQPDYVEVSQMPFSPDELMQLPVAGAWHKSGGDWTGTPMFSIHDDDGVDGKIPSCGSTHIPDRTGYFTMLYPLLQSLGVRGNISMEGWRCGMTAYPPQINVNGQIMRRLESELGWEMQGHSMEVLGDRNNNWIVDSIESDLAHKIMAEANGSGFANTTTSIYDLQTKKQYYPSADHTEWIESPKRFIKPYAYDYSTKRPLTYIPDHDVAYHWGRWFQLAKEWGFKATAWVQHNAISSHDYAKEILKYAPYGFSDNGEPFYNLPPMKSTANRLLAEGQTAPGYIGENSDDNSYDFTQYVWFCNHIDECAAENGWVVIALHTYRKCWKNYIPGKLVSEGGDYPDEWVEPLKDMDFLNDPLTTPPARLGINDWSEWHPCPGSRLEMLRDIILYCLEKGMINVTSSEGYEIMKNIRSSGYFNNGVRIGNDRFKLIDDRNIYPHYIESVTGEEFYFNPLISDQISFEFSVIEMPEPEVKYPASMASGILPIIYITTEDGQPIEDLESEIPAKFRLVANNQDDFESEDPESEDTIDNNQMGRDQVYEDLTLTIKGWVDRAGLNAKKSYMLKFDTETSLFALPDNRHYILLSHIGDYKSWLAAELGFELSRNLGMKWTPRMHPIELVVNGSYEGTYFLCEEVRADEGRLGITRQGEAESGSDVTPNGWLMMIDNTDKARQIRFKENSNGPTLKITPQSPTELSKSQRNWIENELQRLNTLLYFEPANDEILDKTFSIDSFVKYFIIREILEDFNGYSQDFFIYSNLAESPLWAAGPIWNPVMNSTEKTSYIAYNSNIKDDRDIHWIGQFMKYPAFEEAFKRIWSEFYTDDNLEALLNYLATYGAHLQPAFDANNLRWEEECNLNNINAFLFANDAIDCISRGLVNNSNWINAHQNLVEYTKDPLSLTTSSIPYILGKTFFIDDCRIVCRDEGFKPGSLRIMSTDGRTIRCSNDNTLDISDIIPGVYIISGVINNQLIVGKIIR